MAHFVYTGLKENLPSVREAAFYLCTDTRELYFGENLFTAAVRPYTGERPTNPAVGILYVNTDTGVGEIYDGSQWIPLIGDIDASNVYFDSDLVFTYQFGKYIPVDGKVTVPAEGKSFKEVLSDAYAEDQMPDITQPSVSLVSSQIKAYEVGTSVTPAYTATFNPGSYEYGPETGVEVESWEVTDTNGGSKDTATGSFDAFVVGDDTSYSITAKATHTAGVVPNTALENEYAAGQIKAGTKQSTKSKISGYRNSFYGTLSAKDGEINSALVRSLPSKSNKALANGNTFTITIPTGALRVMFAYPATLRDVTSVQDVNGMNAEIKGAFTLHNIEVEGVSGYTAIGYKVYVMDLANANDTANTYKVTI